MGNWEPILAGEVDVSLLDGITNTAEGYQYLGDNTNYNYLVVDDFESYSIDPETFRTIWLDGSGHFTDTGELVRNGSGSYAKHETQKVHDGAQSMYLSYDNIGGWCPHLYSEVERTWDTAQDWTANDTTVLTLWIRGYEWNSNESFYVGLEDTDH